MSSPARDKARRSRIGQQHLATHARLARIVIRRQSSFWSAVTASILATMSRALSEHVYIDQIFQPFEWGSQFRSAVMPALKTAAYGGVAFESEWIHSATGEATQQSIQMLSMRIEAESHGWRADQEGIGKTPKMHSIQQGNFSMKIVKDFFRDGNGVGTGAGIGPNITKQQYGTDDPDNPDSDIPDINVPMSGGLQEDINRYLENKSVGIWSKVGQTTKRALQLTIKRGLAEGDSLKDLIRRVRGVMRTYSKYEARRVAITETTAAMNFGQHAERTELGIENKEWVSTIDDKTRVPGKRSFFDHLSPAGQVTRQNVPFIISGESLMFPGDVSLGASAGNVIHCRCAGVGAWLDNSLTGGRKKAVSGGGD